MAEIQKFRFFTIDLTKTSSNGEFGCPRCRIKISPDDRTEKVYTVVEPVMKGDALDKIVLQCNRCGSEIHLVGFRAMNK